MSLRRAETGKPLTKPAVSFKKLNVKISQLFILTTSKLASGSAKRRARWPAPGPPLDGPKCLAASLGMSNSKAKAGDVGNRRRRPRKAAKMNAGNGNCRVEDLVDGCWEQDWNEEFGIWMLSFSVNILMQLN